MNRTVTRLGALFLGIALASTACTPKEDPQADASPPSVACNAENLDQELTSDGELWDCEAHTTKSKKRKKNPITKKVTTSTTTHTSYAWEIEDGD